MSLFDRLRNADRMHPEPEDLDGAEQMEAGRLHLRSIDPDAARILTTSALDSVQSWKASDQFTKELAEYQALKDSKGKTHLWRLLYADYV